MKKKTANQSRRDSYTNFVRQRKKMKEREEGERGRKGKLLSSMQS